MPNIEEMKQRLQEKKEAAVTEGEKIFPGFSRKIEGQKETETANKPFNQILESFQEWKEARYPEMSKIKEAKEETVKFNVPNNKTTMTEISVAA